MTDGFQCPEHEQAVLGALKLDNKAFDDIRLLPRDFTDRRNRAVFEAIVQIIEAGGTADDITINDELRKSEVSIDRAYVSELSAVTAANISVYAEKVKEASRRRQLHVIGTQLKEGAAEGNIDDLLSDVEKALTGMYDDAAQEMLWLADILHGAMKHLDELHGGLTGIPTGFKVLDGATNGLQNGDLIIIGARASIGKTAMALTIARSAAKAGYTVGFFSCEMSQTQLVYRLLAAESNLNLLHVNRGMFGDEDSKQLTEAASRLYVAPIILDDTSNPLLTHIRSGARRMKRMGVQIIFVDYLTLIRHGSTQMSRPERVGQISKSLKQLARELDLPIVAMSQLNRDAEGQQPTLAELRQSGEIEEDSDVVILLHRKREENDQVQEAIINLAKHRNGPLTKFKCMFFAKSAKFADKYTEHKGENNG